MQRTIPALVLFLSLGSAAFASAAEKKPQEMIIGNWMLWQDNGLSLSLEFRNQGEVITSLNGFDSRGNPKKYPGQYRFIDDKTIELTWMEKGQVQSSVLKIKTLTAKELILVDSDGKEDHMKRVKSSKIAFGG